ncbi:hypothetical protein CLAFUR0_13888 [Fulvia fulva]|nr:hypothetical protein CLAFUR0_13888 [Fulvia fulva]
MHITTTVTTLLTLALSATAQCSPTCPTDNAKNVTITANNQELTYFIGCGLNIIGPDLARYPSTDLAACAQDCANNGTAYVGATFIQVVGDCVQHSEVTQQAAYAASANAQSAVLMTGPEGWVQPFQDWCGPYCR